jgi:PTH1 family peptidyl-tRNA hydrolase
MLIVGLGNPGEKYSLTRHNVGFMVIDELIKRFNATKTSSSFKGELYKSNDIFLLKPLTYMNLSGESVVMVKNYFKIETNKIVVIHDDLDLPFGAVRFKKGGGHGGHNGLKSCDNHISKEYIRVRIGIGKPKEKCDVASYVLSNFTKEEQKKLNNIISHTCDAIEALLTTSLDKVSSLYTLKK